MHIDILVQHCYLIYGFFAPKGKYPYFTDEIMKNNFIMKTHNVDIDRFIRRYQDYDLYFVVSERDNKI